MSDRAEFIQNFQIPRSCNTAYLPNVLLTVSRAGVPHIVLPVWFDTYDFAKRVEYLGIGLYPSRRTAPHVSSKDLSEAISTVIDDNIGGSKMLKKARQLKALCAKVEGREVATRKILEIMEDEVERRKAEGMSVSQQRQKHGDRLYDISSSRNSSRRHNLTTFLTAD